MHLSFSYALFFARRHEFDQFRQIGPHLRKHNTINIPFSHAVHSCRSRFATPSTALGWQTVDLLMTGVRNLKFSLFLLLEFLDYIPLTVHNLFECSLD